MDSVCVLSALEPHFSQESIVHFLFYNKSFGVIP
jgi:hypothetical protein